MCHQLFYRKNPTVLSNLNFCPAVLSPHCIVVPLRQKKFLALTVAVAMQYDLWFTDVITNWLVVSRLVELSSSLTWSLSQIATYSASPSFRSAWLKTWSDWSRDVPWVSCGHVTSRGTWQPWPDVTWWPRDHHVTSHRHMIRDVHVTITVITEGHVCFTSPAAPNIYLGVGCSQTSAISDLGCDAVDYYENQIKSIINLI